MKKYKNRELFDLNIKINIHIEYLKIQKKGRYILWK